MVLPGLLVVGMTVGVGIIFKWIYYAGGMSEHGASGAEVIGGYLMAGTITGILMALFLNNGGGAWDNAKKYIETGAYGGKKSDPHKASVVGDTVGDPFTQTPVCQPVRASPDFPVTSVNVPSRLFLYR